MDRKGSRIEMKEITAMVRENFYSEAESALNKEIIKKAAPKELSRLLLELIPLRSRTAKEMAARLLEYGRPDPAETDGKGETLLKRAVKSGRTDILNGITAKTGRRALRRKGLAEDWALAAEYLLDHQQKTAAQKLLKLGVLRIIRESAEDEAWERTCREILRYKDETMMRAVLRTGNEIEAKILFMPKTASEKQFMRLVLNKYGEKINIEESRERLWETAFACGTDEFMSMLLKKKKDYQYLARIAGGSVTVFRVLDGVRPRNVLPEVRKEVLLGAFLSEEGRQRYEYLRKKGWARGEKRKESLSILEDVRGLLSRKRYDKSRYGQKERAEDRNRLNYLIKCEAAEAGKAVCL